MVLPWNHFRKHLKHWTKVVPTVSRQMAHPLLWHLHLVPVPSNLDTGIQAGHFHSDLIYLPVPLEQSYSKALCFSELKITDRDSQNGRKHLQVMCIWQGRESKIYKELLQLNSKEVIFINGKGVWIDASPKDKQKANKHLKRYSTTLTIKEMQI